MNFRHLAIAAAVAASLPAAAATFGERFDPAKLVVIEAADGAVSATYNGAAVDKVLLFAGASASSKTIGTFVIEDNCDKATLSVLWNNATGADQRAYACDMKAGNIINKGATGSLVFIKRDKGGSTQGVQPIANPTKQDFMDIPAGCTAVAPAPAQPDLNVPNYYCGSLKPLFADAGLSDVEPVLLTKAVNGGSGSLTTVGTMTVKGVFQQLFAAAVNLKAYRALQATQGLAQDDLPANRPTLSSSFVASALAGKLNGGGTKRGWGMVISDTVDADVHAKQINVCRRKNGSGTQATSNVYFLGAGCTAGSATPAANTTALAVKGNGTSANATAYTSATLVEGCLTTVDGLTDATLSNGNGYAIAVLGRDSDPLAPIGGVPNDKLFRYVKLDGAQPEAHPDPTSGKCDGTKNFAGCDDAQHGRYDVVFETTMQWNSATPGNQAKVETLNAIATSGFNAAALKANPAAVVAGAMAPPTTYSGFFGNLALGSDAQVYASRVTRGGNSCSPLLVAK